MLFVVFASAALVVYTRRIEFAILGGTPVALLLLSNYRLATSVTVWVVLIWMLRLPSVFFEVLQFSYVVYASVALTLGGVRAAHRDNRSAASAVLSATAGSGC